MKIIFIGDVFAKYGCQAVEKYVPILKEKLGADFVVANAENAAYHGFTADIVGGFFSCGVDGLTSGNHMWDNDGIHEIIDDPRIVRPGNLVAERPGKGYTVLESKSGYKLLIVNVLGRLFMGDKVSNPFEMVDEIAAAHKMGEDVNGILVDFHTETTAEKNAMGHYCDGKVSMVVGTHTHMPTSDHRIMPGGTAYQTDVGMTGFFDSVIGDDKEAPTRRFAENWDKQQGHFPAEGEATLCACLVEVDETTGLAKSIEPIRIGGILSQTHSF